jgi:hypothetical protein
VILEFDGSAKIPVGTQPYRDQEQLRKLRATYRGSHFFKRVRDRIISVAVVAGHSPVGEEVVQWAAGDNHALVASLALEALLRYFHQFDRLIWSHKPLRVLSSRPEDLLLSRSVPDRATLPAWLEQRVCYAFDTRVVYPESRSAGVLLAVGVKTHNLISAPCSDLIAAGISLEGRYVQVHVGDGDPRLSPKPRLVGRVVEGKGEVLQLDDHADGVTEVEARQAYLEPRHENLAWCVRSLLPHLTDQILDKLDALACTLSSGPEHLRRIRSMFDHLRTASLEILPGVVVRIGPLLERGGRASWFPRYEVVAKPVLVFDPGGSRTDTWNERGIDKHGPYDQRYFTPKGLRIPVICQAQAQGQVEQFLHKFLEGMPQVNVGAAGSDRRPYEKGFVRRYELERPEVEIFTASGATAGAYRAACRRAIEQAANHGKGWNLAIVQIDDAFHGLSGDANPYLVTKSVFMKHQIPVQEVTLEKMTVPDRDLVYIMNDISIAAYAKLGGTPWLLKADSTIAHELVVGLGSHHLSESRIGAKERVVGITTVFTGDGRYLLESRTAPIPYDEYPRALFETLRAAVETVRQDQNWRSSDAVRLIFHAFKPLKDSEIEAVKRLMAGLGLSNSEYAFVHLADDHPFLVFDESNPGAYFSRTERKGALAPARGVMVKFNRDEVLACFTGAREIKQPSDGMPRPVLLKLHRDSTFKDMTYLARQAFAFSCHSWRTFSPAPMPITILYSQLMAKLLRSLDDVSDWDADAMIGRIGRTLWFL